MLRNSLDPDSDFWPDPGSMKMDLKHCVAPWQFLDLPYGTFRLPLWKNLQFLGRLLASKEFKMCPPDGRGSPWIAWACICPRSRPSWCPCWTRTCPPRCSAWSAVVRSAHSPGPCTHSKLFTSVVDPDQYWIRIQELCKCKHGIKI